MKEGKENNNIGNNNLIQSIIDDNTNSRQIVNRNYFIF